jgi:uncharacterized phage protein (TIGR02218 family)
MITCWRVQSIDKVFCFTDADTDIIFENETYLTGGYFTPGAIYSSSELGQDNFTIYGTIDGEVITQDALLAGEFADAYLEVFLIKNNEKIILKTGWVGGVKYANNQFSLAIASLGAKTNKIIGNCYSPNCRAEFADQYCKINKEHYSFEGEVSSLAENSNIVIDVKRNEPDHYFSGGVLELYNGKKYNVLGFYEGKIILDSVFDLKLELGDKYRITAGCNKTLEHCINKFSNVINFRGEPFIPNRHKLLARN